MENIAPEYTVQAVQNEASIVSDISESLPATNVPATHFPITSKNGLDKNIMNDREAEELLDENICKNHGQIDNMRQGFQESDYFEKIKELQVYLETVKQVVRPGCSQELLKVAVNFMSSVAKILTFMSSTPKRHAAL